MTEVCGQILLSDSPPCPRTAGHWPAVPHRAHYPYGSGRWIDYIPAPAEKPGLMRFLEVDRQGYLEGRLPNGPVHWALVTGSRYWGIAVPGDPLAGANQQEHQAAAAAANLLRVVLHVERGLAEAASARLGILHGACETGADRLANTWAAGQQVLCHGRPANWRPYGIYNSQAGKLRNTEMVETLKPWAAAGHPVICLAFSRDGSAGTDDCADKAETAGIPTYRFDHAASFPLPGDHPWAARIQELVLRAS
jgi:hypothetical protein